MKGVLEALKGQKVAVLAARYQYRGILSEFSDERITLADACAVENSGASNSERPETEDPISGSVHISTNAIEIVYQPKWVHAPLPSEDGYRS
jgi:hypothetical protein